MYFIVIEPILMFFYKSHQKSDGILRGSLVKYVMYVHQRQLHQLLYLPTPKESVDEIQNMQPSPWLLIEQLSNTYQPQADIRGASELKHLMASGQMRRHLRRNLRRVFANL
jgi:hypothetical protein